MRKKREFYPISTSYRDYLNRLSAFDLKIEKFIEKNNKFDFRKFIGRKNIFIDFKE